MNLKFNQVAHFYLGCEMQKDNGSEYTLLPSSMPNNFDKGWITYVGKPVLRPLVSITEDEAIEIGMFKPKKEWHEPDWIKAKDNLTDALNNKKDIEFTSKEFFQLIKMGFDLFGLIENGEAVRR